MPLLAGITGRSLGLWPASVDVSREGVTALMFPDLASAGGHMTHIDWANWANSASTTGQSKGWPGPSW